MFENAKKGEIMTTEMAIKLMIKENPNAKYDFKLFNDYALNALDVDYFSPKEIRDMIKKYSGVK